MPSPLPRNRGRTAFPGRGARWVAGGAPAASTGPAMNFLDTATGDQAMGQSGADDPVRVASHSGAMAGAWHVVETGFRDEALARDSIQSLGFTAFLPMVAKRLGSASVLHPLFPRYLFALFDAGEDWGGLRRARGVVDVLRAVGTQAPATVDARRIEAIMAHCTARQVVASDPRPALIAAGLSVRVTTGLWADHQGVCLWSSHERIALLMEVMGRELRVVLPRRSVTEASGE